MATVLDTPRTANGTAPAGTVPQGSMTELVRGIINDTEKLFEQQLRLFRVEVTDDLKKLKGAMIFMAAGAAVLTLGAVVLAHAAALGLQAAFPQLPMWGAYGITGVAFVGVGVALALVGQKRLDANNPLPEQSAQELKENVKCLTNALS